MGMHVPVIFGFDDFFELFFLQGAMICTAFIFNDLGEKIIGRTSLNLFWIFSNLHWVKSIDTDLNTYKHPPLTFG